MEKKEVKEERVQRTGKGVRADVIIDCELWVEL